MTATPFGIFNGKKEIEAFWEKLIADGFSTVEYINPVITTINNHSAILTATWSMNKASGVITKELWILQNDGTAKLSHDMFEVE